MTVGDLFVEKRPLKIGRRIGRGGEGDVFELGDDVDSAIKIYTVSDLKPREEKVEAMVANGLASRSTLASFPNAVVRDRSGRFRGFKMKLVRDHKPLHELYAPGARKQFFPQADYRFLVRAAANLARAVASVHASGCVIGDINHSGALFSAKATASLIDADSFQFSLGSRVFFCKVGVPEYTPPELQGQPLGSIVRTANHDCFGLAVIIFQLLFMGRHPFVGTVRRGDIPPLHEAIRDYRFVYTDGRNVGMDQPPGTPAVSDFPLDVGKYFEAAFGRQSRDQRPMASDWIRVLDTLESSLVQCAKSKLHYYPRDSDECPWCYMEEQLGTVLFVPFVPGAKLVEAVDPGAAAFNISAIWQQISAVSAPPRERILPKVEPTGSAPKTPLLEKFFARVTPQMVLSAVGALAVLIFAPKLWFVWLGLAGYAVFGARKSASDKVDPLRKKLTETDSRWFNAVLAWQKRAGVDELLQLHLQLQAARDEYIGLEEAKRREIDRYRSQRREKQLQAFLENYQIQNARIRGIGTAKQAALASYGIDTAADISTPKVLAVPGIGPAIAEDLVKWRSSCEGRFRYSDAPNRADAQELSNISLKYISRAAELRRALVAGPANLNSLSQRIKTASTVGDPLVSKITGEQEALRQRIKDLGGTVSPTSFEWPTPRRPTPPPIIPSSPPPPPSPAPSRRMQPPIVSTATVPTCPRCSSTMVRRVARRGRNAGGSFWGCSRFPVCRGTRNI